MTDSRGQFALHPGTGPKITRKIAGRIVEEPLRKTSELEEMDELLEGVTTADLQGPAARWLQHSGGTKTAAPGTGANALEGDGYLDRHSNYDNPGGQALDSIPDHLNDEITDEEHHGRERVRPEVGDFHRKNDPHQTPSGIYEPDDTWSMDLEEDTSDRNRERGHGTPLIASLEDEIEDLFRVK